MTWLRIRSALTTAWTPGPLEAEVWAAARARRGPWAVALSGGADSIALLLLVSAEAAREGRAVLALHVNHGLRGRASAGDARYCRSVCRALGVELRVRPAPRRRPKEGISEALLRGERLAFFRAEMGRAKSRVLFLGHQRDDVAESLLMRLARGSGAAGLSAPRPVQAWASGEVFLRPLLDQGRAELRESLAAAGGRWRDDASNAGDGFFRNRVRQSVIGAWTKAAGRDAVKGASRSRRLLEEDDQALEDLADAFSATVRGPGGTVLLGALAETPKAVCRRLMHRWLAARGMEGALSATAFDRLLEGVRSQPSGRMSAGVARFVVWSAGRLRIEAVRKKRGK